MFSYPSIAFLSPFLSLTRYEALFSVFISLSLFLYLSLSFTLYFFIYITLSLTISLSFFSLLWFSVVFNGVFCIWFFLTGWWTLGPHSDEKFWSSCVARKLVNHGKCSGSLYRYFLFLFSSSLLFSPLSLFFSFYLFFYFVLSYFALFYFYSHLTFILSLRPTHIC